MGCSLWGHKESDKTKRLNNNDSLGYSLSDSSEELSQTGKGGARMYQFLLGEKKNKTYSQTSKYFCKSQKPDISS